MKNFSFVGPIILVTSTVTVYNSYRGVSSSLPGSGMAGPPSLNPGAQVKCRHCAAFLLRFDDAFCHNCEKHVGWFCDKCQYWLSSNICTRCGSRPPDAPPLVVPVAAPPVGPYPPPLAGPSSQFQYSFGGVDVKSAGPPPPDFPDKGGWGTGAPDEGSGSGRSPSTDSSSVFSPAPASRRIVILILSASPELLYAGDDRDAGTTASESGTRWLAGGTSATGSWRRNN